MKLINRIGKSLLLLLFLTIISNQAQGQCFCGDIYFKVLKAENSEYSINVLKPKLRKPNLHSENYLSEKGIIFKRQNKDTLNFGLTTGSGIDTLTFEIKDLRTKKAMTITTIGLNSDIQYYINLPEFKTGHYIFNWREIDSCLHEQFRKKEIDCNGKKISLIWVSSTSFFPFSITNIKLEDFKLK